MKAQRQTQEREFIVDVCIGHDEPVIDRCVYCVADALNIHCEVYRPVPKIKYIINEDEDEI